MELDDMWDAETTAMLDRLDVYTCETIRPIANSDQHTRETLPYIRAGITTGFHTTACLTTYLDSFDPRCPCGGKVV